MVLPVLVIEPAMLASVAVIVVLSEPLPDVIDAETLAKVAEIAVFGDDFEATELVILARVAEMVVVEPPPPAAASRIDARR